MRRIVLPLLLVQAVALLSLFLYERWRSGNLGYYSPSQTHYAAIALFRLFHIQWPLLCLWLVFANRPSMVVRIGMLLAYSLPSMMVWGGELAVVSYSEYLQSELPLLAIETCLIVGGFMLLRQSGLTISQSPGNVRFRLSLRGLLWAVTLISVLLGMNAWRQATAGNGEAIDVFNRWVPVVDHAVTIWLLSWAALGKRHALWRSVAAIAILNLMLLIAFLSLVRITGENPADLFSLRLVADIAAHVGLSAAIILASLWVVRRQGNRWAWNQPDAANVARPAKPG